MTAASNPGRLGEALSQLISLRGFARVRADEQLAEIWKEVAGPRIADDTRLLGINRGVLKVAVNNAPLLSELVAFYKASLLEELNDRHPELKISGLTFRLRGDVLQ